MRVSGKRRDKAVCGIIERTENTTTKPEAGFPTVAARNRLRSAATGQASLAGRGPPGCRLTNESIESRNPND